MAKREENVTWLTTNCDCHKGKEKVLANKDNYSDDDLNKLVENAKVSQVNQLVVNSVSKEFGDEFKNVTINEIPAFIKKKMDAKKGKDAGEEEEPDGDEPVKNQAMTMAQFEDSMPQEAKAVWNAAKQVEQDERTKLIGRLTANVKDPAKKQAMTAKFNDRSKTSLEDLRDFVAMMPAPVTRNNVVPATAPVSYFGVQPFTPPVQNSEADQDLLDVPTLNWAELAADTKKRNN